MTENDDKQRLKQAHQLGADLCHDMAAQIFSINGIGTMLERLLPELITAHEFAVSQGKLEPLTERDIARLKRIQSGLPKCGANLSKLQNDFWQSLDALVNHQLSEHSSMSKFRTGDSSTKCRILVVDDEPVFMESFTDMFESLNCEVSTAKSGNKALQILAEERFDLILMDCRMPQLDGYETTRRIRKQEQANELQTTIIGLTASPLVEDRDKGLAAGMNDFITKPLSLDQARSLLTRYTKS